MDHICFNGKIVPADQPVVLAANKSYRYGDGLFETMKFAEGKIRLEGYHFDRLFNGCELLEIKIPSFFSAESLKQDIAALCDKNAADPARVRLSVSRGNGGLIERNDSLQYIIESWPLGNSFNQLNENGLEVGVYPVARKTCDPFSNLKSANFLSYSMAARYASQNKWNDCLVLNTHNRIADSTIANIFIIKEGSLYTPPLSEGCIAGVMRRYLLENMADLLPGTRARELPLAVEDLHSADEVFLSNAVQGIKWVRHFDGKNFTNQLTSQIYHRLSQTIL